MNSMVTFHSYVAVYQRVFGMMTYSIQRTGASGGLFPMNGVQHVEQAVLMFFILFKQAMAIY